MTARRRERSAADPEKKVRLLEKRLAKSELHRAELEQLMDGSQAFQRRVIEEVEQAKAEIEQLYGSLSREKARTDLLLKSIMPEAVAEELKANGMVQPRRVASATVMFADFVDFTSSTESMDPIALVGMLDHYYSAFDRIVAGYGVEKVKTIGDAYMCVAGDISGKGPEDHAGQMCAAAFDLLEFSRRNRHGAGGWDVRIGLSSGPLSSGVVGTDRLSYDIWGDTVNTAARVVAAGAVNKVFLSDSTYELLKTKSGFVHHGDIEAKGKGKVIVYSSRP